jgi:Tol biopolymer transport system component
LKSSTLAVLLALALTWPAGDAHPAKQRRPRIVFTRTGENRNGQQIWTMRGDGENKHRLTRGHVDSNPAWSPDGKRIVFQRLIKGRNTDLFVMSARGTNVTQLTDAPNLDGYAAWSPNGSRIAFTRNFKTGDAHTSQIFVMAADGTDVEQITSSKFSSSLPTWSPNGRRIAFSSGKLCESRRQTRCGTALYVMNADGSDRQRITPFNRVVHVEYPAWSPNGRWIAYDRTGDCCLQTGVYLVRPSGDKRHRISNNVARHPSWSPDGRWLAVDYGAETEKRDLFAISRDGSKVRTLTRGPAFEATPSWSGVR